MSTQPEVLLSWFWPKRIPASLLERLPRGGFGVHPSLLPRWRGPDPYFWTVYAGDSETGVTVHRLQADYDTGEILAQDRLAVGSAENAWRLARRLDALGLARVRWLAARLAEGHALGGRAQDDRLATSAPLPSAELLAIDWSQGAEQIVRLVRAAAPYPGATTTLGEAEVEILAAELCSASLPRALAPSEAVSVEGRVVVQTGVGGVVVAKVRTEGGMVLHGSEVTRLFPRGLTRL